MRSFERIALCKREKKEGEERGVRVQGRGPLHSAEEEEEEKGRRRGHWSQIKMSRGEAGTARPSRHGGLYSNMHFFPFALRCDKLALVASSKTLRTFSLVLALHST